MQTVLIMGVGALVLICFNGMFRKILPKIEGYIQSVVSGKQVGSGSGFEESGFTYGSKPVGTPTNGVTRDRDTPESPQRKPPENWLSDALDDQMPKQLADASNALRNAIAKELKDHLQITLPTEAAYLDGLIDDLINTRDKLDPLSAARRTIEEEISAIRRLSNKDLKNMMEGIEGRLATDKSIAPILRHLGSMFNLDSMLEQDRWNQLIGKDPSTTKEDAYRAYLDTFRVSGGMLADGVINTATRGGANPGRPSQIANNAGVQVAIGLAADRAGLAVAESAFPTFNAAAYWLYDNGYSPRPPRFPRDWNPPQIYK